MKEKTSMKKIVVKDQSGKPREISGPAILNIKSRASVSEYCGTFNVTLRNDNGLNTKVVEPKEEMEIWAGYEGEGISKIMAGYVDKVILSKNEESKETVEISGRSYESLLFDTKVSGKIEYTSGLSQVVREILKGLPFDLSGILDSKGTGVVIIRNTPVIDIIRQISEENGWVFRIDYDKVAHFEPIDSAVKTHTLKSEDIKSYKITKS